MKLKMKMSAVLLIAVCAVLATMMFYADNTYAAEMISDVQVTVKAPAPGTTSAGAPVVTVSRGTGFIFKTGGWVGEDGSYDDVPEFPFEAGKNYTMWINLEAETGYYFSDSLIPAVVGGQLTGTPEVYTYGDYSGATFTVDVTCAAASKKANPLAVEGKTASVAYSKLKKATQYLKVSKVLSVSKAQGTVTYTKLSGNSKITINKKTGKVTIKKGLKKKSYKVKVKVTAAGNENYAKGSKTKTFTVKVK